MKEIYLIVAADLQNGIGKNGKMPWNLKEDMKFFQETTLKTDDSDKQNMVIMGRTTWESIPKKFRPLAKRQNVVLTRSPDYKAEGAKIASSLDKAIELADESIETIFIIGGGRVYTEAIRHSRTTGVYLTRIDHQFDCDTFFPEIPSALNGMEMLSQGKENGIKYTFLRYHR